MPLRSKSEALFAAALEHIPGGVNSPVRAFRAVGGNPFFVESASGARLRTVDGDELLDYVGTWGPAILGHAHPKIIAAVKAAAERGTSFGVPNALEVALAFRVKEFVPSVQKVRFCNSGTEACMSAIRLARGFTRRDKLVKFDGCYHGHADSLLVKAGSGALTLGHPDSAGVPADFAKHTLVVPFNDREALAALFATHGQDIAAVIVEGVPANAGLYLPRPGFYELIARLCREHGALFILDEVMTGFRLAKGGAQELFGLTPDLSTFGKIIGGGLPVGAYGGREDLMRMVAPDGPVYQAGTLSGNPLAMTAGLWALSRLDDKLYRKLERLGSTLAEGLSDAAHRAGVAISLNRVGSLLTVFFTDRPVMNYDDAKLSDTAAYGTFFQAMLAQGVYLPPSQFEAWFLSGAHTRGDVDDTIRAARKAFKAVARTTPA